MSKAEVLAELPRLTPAELAEVQARLDELIGDAWSGAAGLSEAERKSLDAELDAYAHDPEAGSAWDAVVARVRARLQS